MHENDVARTLDAVDFIKIEGKRKIFDREYQTFIFMLSPNSQCATKAEEFNKRILETLPMGYFELVVISNAESPSTNIVKKVRVAKQLMRNTFVEFLSYNNLICVVPEHKAVPKHEIISDNEVNRICDTMFIQKINLPRIKVTDAALIWYGAKPGQVVRISRDSDICVQNDSYRIVVPAYMN